MSENDLKKSEELWGLYNELVEFETCFVYPFIYQDRVAGHFKSVVSFKKESSKVESIICIYLNCVVNFETIISTLVRESIHVAIAGALKYQTDWVETVIKCWILNEQLFMTANKGLKVMTIAEAETILFERL